MPQPSPTHQHSPSPYPINFGFPYPHPLLSWSILGSSLGPWWEGDDRETRDKGGRDGWVGKRFGKGVSMALLAYLTHSNSHSMAAR